MKYMQDDKSTKPKMALNMGSLLSLVLVAMLLGGAAYSLYVGQQALQGLEYVAPLTAAPQTKKVSVPELEVNQNHQRQGPVIEVDESKLGRENPFEKP